MKKATGTMAVVVGLLLMVVFIVLFYPFIQGILDLFTKSGNTAACKISLLGGKAAAKECREEVKIFKDKVEVGGKKLIEKGTQGTQNMAKEALAKLLTMCLSKGGGYDSRSFNPENWLATESVCLECYKLTIDEEVGAINGFTDYLGDTNVKGLVTDKKYIEALTRDPQHLKAYMEYGAGLGLAPSKGAFQFKPNEEYTAFFLGRKKGYIPRNLKHLWDIVTVNFLDLFFGNQDAYFAYIVESNKLGTACNRKVN